MVPMVVPLLGWARLSRLHFVEFFYGVSSRLCYGKCWGCGAEFAKGGWIFQGTMWHDDIPANMDFMDVEQAALNFFDTAENMGNGLCTDCAEEVIEQM